METGDDDYSTETQSELSFGAVNFDSIVQEARRVSGRESVRKARKKQKPEHKPRAVLPSNLHSIVITGQAHHQGSLWPRLRVQHLFKSHRSGPAHAEVSSPEGAKVGEDQR
jgi:hypothetical protein